MEQVENYGIINKEDKPTSSTDARTVLKKSSFAMCLERASSSISERDILLNLRMYVISVLFDKPNMGIDTVLIKLDQALLVMSDPLH